MRLANLINYDVPRFQIPVKNPVLMRVMDGTRYLCHERSGIRFIQLQTKPRNSFRQAFSPYRFHGEVRLAFVLADLVNPDDIRVVETGCGFSFGPEPANAGLRRSKI